MTRMGADENKYVSLIRAHPCHPRLIQRAPVDRAKKGAARNTLSGVGGNRPVVVAIKMVRHHHRAINRAGETVEQLLEAHPRLTHKAVLAALDFATQALR